MAAQQTKGYPIAFRASPEQVRRWSACAKAVGKNFSQFVKETVDRRCDELDETAPEDLQALYDRSLRALRS